MNDEIEKDMNEELSGGKRILSNYAPAEYGIIPATGYPHLHWP